jgi:hypothetical protein
LSGFFAQKGQTTCRIAGKFLVFSRLFLRFNRGRTKKIVWYIYGEAMLRLPMKLFPFLKFLESRLKEKSSKN